jgi:hypothetical protein
MIDILVYLKKNHPHLWEFSYSDTEVFGKFDNGKTYSSPIEEFESVLIKLQQQYDADK